MTTLAIVHPVWQGLGSIQGCNIWNVCWCFYSPQIQRWGSEVLNLPHDNSSSIYIDFLFHKAFFTTIQSYYYLWGWQARYFFIILHIRKLKLCRAQWPCRARWQKLQIHTWNPVFGVWASFLFSSPYCDKRVWLCGKFITGVSLKIILTHV